MNGQLDAGGFQGLYTDVKGIQEEGDLQTPRSVTVVTYSYPDTSCYPPLRSEYRSRNSTYDRKPSCKLQNIVGNRRLTPNRNAD